MWCVETATPLPWTKTEICTVGEAIGEDSVLYPLMEITPLLPIMTNLLIGSVACGAHHCLFLTNSGQIYSFGLGKEGRLGHGDEVTHSEPKLISLLKDIKIVAVACGMLHSVALTEDGEVATWGANKYGQLGHENPDSHILPYPVASLRNIFIVSAHCGRAHTAVLTREGVVYTFGQNLCGQLGDPDTDARPFDLHKPFFEGRAIRKMVTGHYHSLSLTVDGSVYGWGYNTNGELGVKELGHLQTPRALELDFLRNGEKVEDVSAGAWHSCLVTNFGRLFSWGLGDSYRLGHGNEESLSYPQEVLFPKNQFVHRVACGAAHTIAIVKEQ